MGGVQCEIHGIGHGDHTQEESFDPFVNNARERVERVAWRSESPLDERRLSLYLDSGTITNHGGISGFPHHSRTVLFYLDVVTRSVLKRPCSSLRSL